MRSHELKRLIIYLIPSLVKFDQCHTFDVGSVIFLKISDIGSLELTCPFEAIEGVNRSLVISRSYELVEGVKFCESIVI